MSRQASSQPQETVWIVGVGRVGKLIASAEIRDGGNVSYFDVHSEYVTVNDRFVNIFAGAKAGTPDRIWFTVPDDKIAEVVQNWSEAGCQPKIAFHTSGWHSPDILRPIAGTNREYLALHPMRSIQRSHGYQWHGTVVTLCGTKQAVSWARAFVERRNAKPVEVKPEEKRSLHLLSQLAANIPFALVEAAYQLAGNTTVPKQFIHDAVVTMVRDSTARALEEGALAATGPVARGDAKVVQESIEELTAYPQLQSFYREYAKLLLSQMQNLSPDDSRTAAWETIRKQLG